MLIQVCKDENEWTRFADSWLSGKMLQYHAKSVYIPAGESPRPLYRLWEVERPSHLQGLELIQIDEVISGTQAGMFKRFFIQELPHYQKNIKYISSPEIQADLAILGLGLNGHVAFHEPGVAPNFFGGAVDLSAETVLNLKLEIPSLGITYGVGAFAKTKAILFLVRGIKKKNILQKVLDKSSQLPASYLINHPDITFLTDFEV